MRQRVREWAKEGVAERLCARAFLYVLCVRTLLSLCVFLCSEQNIYTEVEYEICLHFVVKGAESS